MLDKAGAGAVHEATLRVEDDALIRGRGKFIDDLKLPGQAAAVFLRSPHAHAAIREISAEAALAVPGVIAVLTAADMEGVGSVSRPIPIIGKDGKPTIAPHRPALAATRVMHVGDPVALVVAESAAIANDAAERIEVDYDPLPSVIDARAALKPDAPNLWPEAPGNLAIDFIVPRDDGAALAAVERAIAGAAHVVVNETINQRLAGVPLEPRGATAVYDAEKDRYTLHCPCQGAGVLANGLAAIMGIAPEKLRVMANDVGGAFGLKTPPYPEYPALLVAAKKAGRPVHWMATRAEAFQSDHQARDQYCRATLAIDRFGKFLALKIEATANFGAYCTFAGPRIATTGFADCFPITYDIPKMSISVRGAFTNTVPVGPYRGAGRPEANYAMERLVDAAARQTGIDPLLIRRRNFIAPMAFPYATAAGHRFDSGDFAAIFEKAVTLADAAGFPARRKAAEEKGRLRGFGISCFLEHAGVDQFEGTAFVFDDRLHVRLGVHASGQSHRTVFRNVVADRLGLPRDSVILEEGDSDFAIKGGPAVASRSAMSAGPAMAKAADIVVEKGRRIAAAMLEASEDDIGYEGGEFVVTGTDRRIGLFEVAKRAAELQKSGEIEENLDTRADITTVTTYPNGCHIAEVEIEPDTGVVAVARYTAIDDCGNVLDHTVADGQTIGGMAQGLGQALIEAIAYDEDGQMLSGSLMDYGMPRADMMPAAVAAEFHPVPCTTNVLGVKGVGEAGTTAAIAAIMNAIADAIPEGRGADIAMPATPEKVWRACQEASSE